MKNFAYRLGITILAAAATFALEVLLLTGLAQIGIDLGKAAVGMGTIMFAGAVLATWQWSGRRVAP